jgi:hypothetical protein
MMRGGHRNTSQFYLNAGFTPLVSIRLNGVGRYNLSGLFQESFP